MLARLLSTYPDPIISIADHWLDLGAKTIALFSDGNVLAEWGTNGNSPGSIMTQTIQMGSHIIGEMQVAVNDTPILRNQLAADAKTIATFVQLYKNLMDTTVELVDTRDQLLALYEITQATRGCWEIEETMCLITADVLRMVKAETAFLLVDRNDDLAHIVQSPDQVFDKQLLLELGQWIKAEEQYILIDKKSERTPLAEIHNLLLTPIKMFDQHAGVLGIANKNDHTFMSPDIKLTNAIAEFAGIRLETVIMYQESLEQAKIQTEMALAHNVQYQLLPKHPPVVEGLDLWASYKPASLVGGDFYDFIVRPGWPFTFCVGDVSGKGIPAALLMTVTRTVMRMAIKQSPEYAPDIILERSNVSLYEDLTSLSMLVTAFIAQYRSSTGEFVYANAGHSPVIYLPFRGKARLLRANETALGIFPTTRFYIQRLKLEPGDIFVVGSDGFFRSSKIPHANQGYGYLINALEQKAAQPAAEIVKAILEASQIATLDSQPEDDQTIVVIKKAKS